MKFLSTVLTFGSVVVLSTAFASATTYQFGSYATGAPNMGNENTAMVYNVGLSTPVPGAGLTSSTYTVLPGTVWSSALTSTSTWVSYGQTGPTTPAGSQPGGAYAPTGDYFFSTTFTLDSDATAYTFNVLADDTVGVYVDGVLTNRLATASTGTNTTCNDNVPNCLTVFSSSNITNPGNLAFLTAGTHVITFDVEQIKGVDMGVDWTGTVTTAVPEPSSLILLGTGLLTSAGALMRRRRVKA